MAALIRITMMQAAPMQRIRTSFCKNLHAKCYLNEELCIITSLNLYEFSQVNNNEMGVLIRRSEDGDLYKDAYEEAQRIIRISDEVRISLERVASEQENKGDSEDAAGNFNDLQRMVVTSLPGGGNQIALGAERKKIESWPDVYDSYSAVMSDAERMGNVQGAYEAVLAAEQELRCIHARFVLLDSHLSKQHIQTKSAHVQAIAALTEAEQTHDSAIRAMQETIQALDRDTLGRDYDAAWNFNALVTQANSQLRVAKEQDAKLADDIQAIKANFVSRRGTPPEHFYDTHRQQMGPDKAEHAREWVPVFKAWYSTEHETYRNLLRVEARTIAEAVGDFHGRMSRFHRDVALFNRSLQDSLNANLGFESISSVSVEIVSSIRELDYWATIEKVADSRVVWMGDPSTMPPLEFAASLRELLEHWQIKEGIRAELTNLIRIQGEVVENGTRRPFKKAEDLETISSHGLSYIVLVLIFIGFINRVRGTAPVNVVWALDEIKDLDVGNVELLIDILTRNNITLVSACPDPDPDVLALFKNRCSIRADRCIYDTAGAAGEPEDSSLGEEEACV